MAHRARRDLTPLFVPEWSRVESTGADPAIISISPTTPATGNDDENHDQDARDIRRDQEDTGGSMRRNEHLLKSGALGKCDDPYCTTCPSYFDFSRNLADDFAATQQKRNSLLGGAKSSLSAAFESSKRLSGIYNPHTKLVQRWNQVFAVSCLLAVFIDPLFFLILSVKQGDFCITFNQRFATIVTILRSITDTFYFLHMLLQFRLAYFARTTKASRTADLVDDPKAIAKHYLQGWFLIDVVAVLPIPQFMLWFLVRKSGRASANIVKNALRAIVLFQYVPRMTRILPMLFGVSRSRFTFETAWSNFIINLFIYLLASHVVGSCWYLFGLQRVNQCLRNTCKSESAAGCLASYLDCGSGHLNQGDSNRQQWIRNSNASSDCLVNSTFNYGIYYPAVPLTMTQGTTIKYFYSLFWGFLQISTLGGNLVPSYFSWEVLFTIGIIGLGLLLFALLIGNMQNFLQSLGRRQLELQLRRYDVESWMRRRGLPTDVRSRVRQAVRLKWASTRGINEEELLESLPEDLQKEIRRFLCFVLVKKVRIFTVMDDQVLDAICERLHQMFYIELSEIFRTDGPLHRMLFIVRGTIESIGKDGSRDTLGPGDFCGEELLIWCLEHTVQTSKTTKSNLMRSLGDRAVSTRTVRCLTSVEAFSLEEKDIQYVTEYFTRYMRNPRVQGAIRYESLYFRSLAAERIQAAWKSYKRRKHLLPTRSSDMIEF